MKIATHSGLLVDLFEPDRDTIKIEDIARSLDRLVRFAGHTTIPVHVGGHSVRVSQILEFWDFPLSIQFAGLVHDVTEYLLQDIPGPVKRELRIEHPRHGTMTVAAFEKILLSNLLAALGLGCLPVDSPEVEYADAVALYWEALTFLPGEGHWNKRPPNRTFDGREIDPGIMPDHVLQPRTEFLDLFRQLETRYMRIA